MSQYPFMKKCWDAKMSAGANNYGKYPNFILVHPGPFQDDCRKMSREDAIRHFSGPMFDILFGMKVIQTTTVSEQEPKVLYELEGQKWPIKNPVICPNCKTVNSHEVSPGKYICAFCG
jgi:phage FluMu protein Com